MFFSRVKLEINQLPDHDFKDLFNGQKYREHQLLWKLFDSEKRHFLFRREVNKQHNPGANYNLKGAPIYYIVSHDEPQPYPGFSTETKPYNPSLQVGQQLAFTLRANPVVAKKQEGKKHNARVDVLANEWVACAVEGVTAAERAQRIEFQAKNWLLKRAEQNGFSLQPDAFITSGYHKQKFYKKRNSSPISLSTIDYEGQLTITDTNLFQDLLSKGIGKAKAFGCGLMLVRRLA